jgi:RimJ/RimL family protein N-acetyltransferase
MTLQHIAPPAAPPVGTLRSRVIPRTPALWARSRVTVRPIETGDAEALASAVASDSVTRFIPPPPASVDRFRAFITWAQAEQGAGRQRCFAIVPHATNTAAGLIQVRHADSDADVVEWGFVLAQPLWGTGLFVESAAAVLDILFATTEIRRVEAHTAIANKRGMGVLRKMGFRQQQEDAGVLTATTGTYQQTRWAITADQWWTARLRFRES